MSLRQTTLNIDLEQLRTNFKAVAQHGHPLSLCPVVKANAYGHGLSEVARTFSEAGAAYLAVALCEEGVALRKHGINTPILVLGPAPTDAYHYMIEHQLLPCISNIEQIELLARAAKESPAAYHLKIDTGMSRLGVGLSTLNEVLKQLQAYPTLHMQGVLTHFANADLQDQKFNQHQIEGFRAALQAIHEAKFTPEIIHCSNSAATLDLQVPEQTMLRPGLALYGINPLGPHPASIELQPAMHWHTSPLHIKTIPTDTPVSYGGTWRAQKPTTLAILPVGYADGYRREFSNKASVLIQGRRAPVVGQVCMDHTLVDISDIPGTKLDDEVVLLGQQQEETITPWELASWAQTIPYEILCGISSRVKRTYTGTTSA